ncbi:MAG: hypothetical protein J6U58_02245 [Bacteroidaceae bacterium]|nr:hypothetical protein [Bacteroidaceae bacterium]
MSIKGYIYRIRHNRGYGVQSPSAFFFVTEVLKERLPYYAYAGVEEIADKKGFFCKKHAKALFRITNYFNPTNCIAIESTTAAAIMAMAKPTADKYCISNNKEEIKESIKALLNTLNCQTIAGDCCQELTEAIANVGQIGMLYIGKCEEQASLLSVALPHTNKNSIIIVEGINRSKESRLWWNEVIKDPRTIVTYDMYSYGILFFDKEKCKQNYTLKQ